MEKSIYEKEGKWYHTDECQCDEYGPFDTKIDAKESSWRYNIESLSDGDYSFLIKAIEKHDELYWEKQDTEIDDIEYDMLKRLLQRYDPDHPILNKVHSAVSSSKKVKHGEPMLSLAKAYTPEEVLAWGEKVARSNKERIRVQPKYDGCSGKYEKLILSTRGNGEEGEDISHKIEITKVWNRNGDDTPLKIVQDDIRGEILILDSDFEKYKDTPIRKGGQPYKNSRNACAGILNRDDNENIPNDILTLVPFDAISKVVTLEELRDNKFLEKIISEISELDFPMDGIVFKLDDLEYSKSLGKTSSHYRGEIAFKFTNPTGFTILKDIEWKMGKRKLTPRGHVEPVNISGITVSHINLHNIKYLIDNDIYIGDKIVVERAGDVIPDFVKHIDKPKGRVKPTLDKCPYCGDKVEFISPELYCVNEFCHEKLLNRLCDSVVRIGIERLGKPTVAKMMNQLKVESLKDIFELRKVDILKMDGFAKSSTDNLYDEINKIKKAGVNDWQVLASLNIHGIGRTLSKQILSVYDLDSLITFTEDVLKLSELPNMGDKRSKELHEGLDENRDYLIDLLTTIPVIQTKGEEKEDMDKICFTGKMPEKRSYYETIAEERGLEPSKTVNKDLAILVCMDPESGSSKMVKAKKLGIKVISVDEFMRG